MNESSQVRVRDVNRLSVLHILPASRRSPLRGRAAAWWQTAEAAPPLSPGTIPYLQDNMQHRLGSQWSKCRSALSELSCRQKRLLHRQHSQLRQQLTSNMTCHVTHWKCPCLKSSSSVTHSELCTLVLVKVSSAATACSVHTVLSQTGVETMSSSSFQQQISIGWCHLQPICALPDFDMRTSISAVSGSPSEALMEQKKAGCLWQGGLFHHTYMNINTEHIMVHNSCFLSVWTLT